MNAIPLGVERWKDRVFVTTPRWKRGVPATLSWLPTEVDTVSAPLRPYPNWDWHTAGKAYYFKRSRVHYRCCMQRNQKWNELFNNIKVHKPIVVTFKVLLYYDILWSVVEPLLLLLHGKVVDLILAQYKRLCS